MKVENVTLNKLAPYERNPRQHPQSQIDALADLIKRYGFRVPLLIDAQNVIVAGHGRHLAAQQVGLSSVPCIRIGDMNDDEVKAFRIADNRMSEMSSWNESLLALEVQDLFGSSQELLDGIGWSAKDLEKMISKEVVKKAAAGTRVTAATKKKFGQWKPSKADLIAFEGKPVYVEFSGGKDSSTATLWCKRYLPDHEIHLIYCEMGADHVGFTLHLRAFADTIGLPLTIVRTKETVIDLMLSKGKWPFWQGSYCQIWMYENIDEVIPEGAIVVRGGRAEEKGAKSKVQETRWREHPRRQDIRIYQPLYFAAKGTGEALLENADLPIWEGYATGLQRTACRICPGQTPATYCTLRNKYPHVWQELMDLENILGPGAWQGAHIKGKRRGEIATFSQLADIGDERAAKVAAGE